MGRTRIKKGNKKEEGGCNKIEERARKTGMEKTAEERMNGK